MLVAVSDPTLLGVAALLTATSGAITTLIGIRKTSTEAREAEAERCRGLLREARLEAEAAAAELHAIKMRGAAP